MKGIEATILDVRNNLGKYLSETHKKPFTITKRGKKIAVVIDPITAEKFWEWQEKEELKELYFESKKTFENYGKKFLKNRNVKESDLNEDELTELVANA